ncbi:MAG: 2,3,4,5-tetrahydropyridine-2,6-dicarboxylate N-succinyltransferase [Pseudomonadales bacterium]|nr:2,3,4,5-tetrahydropyridine-2,6-dicarboxylate N-succinyltransferase [Pseudomonadales bacterium]
MVFTNNDAVKLFSLAFGIGTKNKKGSWLEVYYPIPYFNPSSADVKKISEVLGYESGNCNIELSNDLISQLAPVVNDSRQQEILGMMRNSTKPKVACFIESDVDLSSTPEAYLKLHLLSHRYVKPNHINLTGIFSQLPNVAWTSEGAIDPREVTDQQLKARAEGRVLEVSSIDKFPKMSNYVIPSGVRISHTARVRLGAYLGEGTTVMHEGFVNFNAGAIGPNMIEGRLSQGVTMGEGSDLGGGASTMGTLSGGGDIILSIGKDCLIGANAGTGIPLGDRCIIEAGLYITASTIVQVMDENRSFVKVAKARELAGQNDMLFIRNSQTGVVECRSNQKAIQLNETLHDHN